MNKGNIQILEAEYTNEEHRSEIPFLLNEYAKDLLGFRKELDNTVLENLVSGLEKVSNAIVLLAKTDEKIVGMTICFLGFSTFKARPLINIHDFLVLKEYRNHSIGKKLLQEVELIAKKLHCCKITLEVQEKNSSARKLYNSLDFKDSFLDIEAGNQLSLTKEL
mgnify:CR=1 FL=1|jgi:GNAT superfamily N-acetyltransferase